jgi:hypothetical protein
MHWVFWVPNYFFSFTKFVKFYDIFPSPLHFTITKMLKKLHSTTDSHPLFKTEASRTVRG